MQNGHCRCGEGGTFIAPILIVFMSEDWDCPPAGFTRKEMLLAVQDKLLEQGFKVLALERPVCPFVTAVRQPIKLLQKMLGRKRLRLVSRGFYLATPVLALHERIAAHSQALQRMNGRLLRVQLDSWLSRLSAGSLADGVPRRPRVLWIFHPCQSWLMDAVPHDRLIYECYDEYSALVRSESYRTWLKHREAHILARADLVLTTSIELFRTRRPHNPNTILVCNGVEFDLFANSHLLPEPEDLAGIPRPRICYAGAINQRLDWELLEKLAIARPNWSLVMIGPVDRSARIERLRVLPNVYFLRARPRHEIPAYLAHSDVNIIPYVSNRCTAATYPLKLNEYLAVGRPVVSTRFGPDLDEFAEVVRLTEGDSEFCLAVSDALSSGTDVSSVARARAIARSNSWESRAEAIAHSILALFPEAKSERRAICV